MFLESIFHKNNLLEWGPADIGNLRNLYCGHDAPARLGTGSILRHGTGVRPRLSKLGRFEKKGANLLSRPCDHETSTQYNENDGVKSLCAFVRELAFGIGHLLRHSCGPAAKTP